MRKSTIDGHEVLKLATMMRDADPGLSYADSVDAAYKSESEDAAAEAAEARALTMRDTAEEGGDVLLECDRPRVPLLLKRDTDGAVRMNVIGMAESIMRERGIPYDWAMNEAQAAANKVTRRPTMASLGIPSPTHVLTSRLVEQGVRHDDAQNVALLMSRAGIDPETIDGAAFARARVDGSDMTVSMRAAMAEGERSIALRGGR
jgi:hypothetical protein